MSQVSRERASDRCVCIEFAQFLMFFLKFYNAYYVKYTIFSLSDGSSFPVKVK